MNQHNQELNCLSEYEVKTQKENRFIRLVKGNVDRKFKIEKIREGCMPAIITISGFNSEGDNNTRGWSNSINILYPENTWYQVEWVSKKIKIFQNNSNETDVLFDPLSDSKKEEKKPNFLERLWVKLPLTDRIILAPRNNPWSLSMRNCRISSEFLVEALNLYRKDVILIGHSLGARMIFYVLRGLSELEFHYKIEECHLLGGAINNRKNNWLKVNRLVEGSIYNYFSKKDNILKTLYPMGTFNFKPIGRHPIKTPKVININVTNLVSGHSQFIPKFNLFYKKI